MSKVKIISDSTCDLSEELLAQFDVAVLPHPIVRDGELLQDNVTITPDDIYRHYEQTGRLCTTSAPNAYDYEMCWKPWLDEGYEIVHFTISSEMSTGIGLLGLEACDLREQGLSAEKIAAKVREDADKCQASFLVDVIEYLWKGGRCSSVAAIGANILKLKPRIDVLNGNMLSTKKYRGRTAKCFAAYADDMLKGKDNIRQNRIFITHSGIDPDIIELVRTKINEWQPDVENIYVTRAGGTISCHCGPGTLGILYMYE